MGDSPGGMGLCGGGDSGTNPGLAQPGQHQKAGLGQHRGLREEGAGMAGGCQGLSGARECWGLQSSGPWGLQWEQGWGKWLWGSRGLQDWGP